jgi:hypothetical protein
MGDNSGHSLTKMYLIVILNPKKTKASAEEREEMQKCERNQIVYSETLKWEIDGLVRYG